MTGDGLGGGGGGGGHVTLHSGSSPCQKEKAGCRVENIFRITQYKIEIGGGHFFTMVGHIESQKRKESLPEAH